MSNPLYGLPEDHIEIRRAIRAIVSDKIAPYAAEVDEDARYPQERTTPWSRPTSTHRTSPSSTAASAPMPSRP